MNHSNNIDDVEEWTVVGDVGSTRKHKRSFQNPSRNNNKHIVPSKINQQNNNIHEINSNTNDEIDVQSPQGQELIHKLKLRIEECMQALLRFNNTTARSLDDAIFNYPFIIQSLLYVTNTTIHDLNSVPDTTNGNCSICNQNNPICSIVTYGIGNFYKQSSSYSLQKNIKKRSKDKNTIPSINLSLQYSTPMIQLALILLIRQSLAYFNIHSNTDFASAYPHPSLNEESLPATHDRQIHDHSILSYEQQQDIVNMVYFEPLLHPFEQYTLEHHFHIQVLKHNEQGKRCVSQSTSSSSFNTTTTLFYMPHCPMRLYSNVLWANWSYEIFMSRKIILLGNNLKSYHYRRSDLHHDDTNAIFPLLDYTQDIDILNPSKSYDILYPNHNQSSNANHFDHSTKYENSKKKKKNKSKYQTYSDNDISLDMLEKAFIDTTITYFAKARATSNEITSRETTTSLLWPKRPEEYIPNNIENSEFNDGELVT